MSAIKTTKRVQTVCKNLEELRPNPSNINFSTNFRMKEGESIERKWNHSQSNKIDQHFTNRTINNL